MAGWPRSPFRIIGHWLLERRIDREARRIARNIYPALWENVRRKIADLSENDLAEYAKVRAAQLSHQRLDVLMHADPTISGAFASRLLAKSTHRAQNLVMAAVASARRSAA